jgi:O-antigen/teichoic acid export membrane protein
MAPRYPDRRSIMTAGVLPGTVTMATVNAAKYGLQLAVLPVLARILDPTAFGLVALAVPFFLVTMMVSDLGLGNALVRAREPSPELESTVFWLSLSVSSSLAAIVALLAWPASYILSEPRLPPILLAFSLILPIGGALAVFNARIQRECRFDVFATGDVLASSLSSAAAIGAAVLGLGVWSLVVQQFVIWSVKGVWLVRHSNFWPQFYCAPKLAWPHLQFGLNAAGSNMVDLATKSVPPLIVGGLLGVVALGHYSMAYQIIRVPEIVISGPLYLSTFSIVARSGDNPGAVKSLVFKGLRGIVIVLAPLFCGIALVSDSVVQILFGPKWEETGSILVLLAPAGFFLCLYSFVNAVLMGLGHSNQKLRLIILAGCSIGIATLVGSHFGTFGVALGFSLGTGAVAPLYLLVLSRELATSKRVIMGEIATPITAAGIMTLIVSSALHWQTGWDPWSRFFTSVAIAAPIFIAVLGALSWRSVAADLRWLITSGRRAD